MLDKVGAESPLGLLAALEAAPKEFTQQLGTICYEGVMTYIRQHLSATEQREWSSWTQGKSLGDASQHFHFGAHITRPNYQTSNNEATSHIDIALRDRLFAERERLKQLSSPSREEQHRSEEIETQLNKMLDG